jgi:hypothetical protein
MSFTRGDTRNTASPVRNPPRPEFHSRFDPFDETSTQHNLFPEEVGLALFRERGLDDAGAAAADSTRIGKSDFQRVAGTILCHCHQTRCATAAPIFAAHGVAWRLWRNHEHIDIWTGSEQVEMDVQPVGKGQGCSGSHVGM